MLKEMLFYDSYPSHNNQMENHLNRPEVQKAIKHGNGYDVRRTSETTGVPYFYSATHYKDYIVRSAFTLPMLPHQQPASRPALIYGLP